MSLPKILPSHYLVRKIQDWLVLLHNRKKVRVNFCWVPSHVGVDGNERADIMAKAATRLQAVSKVEVAFEDLKIRITSYFRES